MQSWSKSIFDFAVVIILIVIFLGLFNSNLRQIRLRRLPQSLRRIRVKIHA